jgi:uncharacterized protein with PIN domain
MLGSLARWLRFFGFDAEFCGPELDDGEVANLARSANRWLVTRDRELASVGPRSILLRSEDLDDQLVELFHRLGLSPKADLAASRCGECNGVLEAAGPDEVRELVPPYVLRTAERFRRCARCGQIYWPGTHTAKILDTMMTVVSRLDDRSVAPSRRGKMTP